MKKRVQTNSANITTMAVDDLSEEQEQIRVFTYMGGGHHGHSEDGRDSNSMNMTEEHSSMNMETTSFRRKSRKFQFRWRSSQTY